VVIGQTGELDLAEGDLAIEFVEAGIPLGDGGAEGGQSIDG
jgi:hypothetical protein